MAQREIPIQIEMSEGKNSPPPPFVGLCKVMLYTQQHLHAFPRGAVRKKGKRKTFTGASIVILAVTEEET